MANAASLVNKKVIGDLSAFSLSNIVMLNTA